MVYQSFLQSRIKIHVSVRLSLKKYSGISLQHTWQCILKITLLFVVTSHPNEKYNQLNQSLASDSMPLTIDLRMLILRCGTNRKWDIHAHWWAKQLHSIFFYLLFFIIFIFIFFKYFYFNLLKYCSRYFAYQCTCYGSIKISI